MKKIRIFVETELPLLLKNSLFPLKVEYANHPTTMLDRDETFSDELSLGKAEVPGPNPGQGSFQEKRPSCFSLLK
jgi:hypothetical protein